MALGVLTDQLGRGFLHGRDPKRKSKISSPPLHTPILAPAAWLVLRPTLD
jgi:hypothetical protein